MKDHPTWSIPQLRSFLKDTIRKEVDFSQTGQSQGVPMPPLQKPVLPGARLVDLPAPNGWQGVPDIGLAAAVAQRRSRRSYLPDALTLDEVSFPLWATQGLRGTGSGRAFRHVPSAGCRHALETYLVALRVGGLEPGVYRYLPLSHQLVFEFTEDGLGEKLSNALFDQTFASRAAVTFVWAAIPYRMEWRYGRVSHKVIALDAGHVCQNLYLACEAIGAGTCAIGAYDQEALDELLRLDGEDEFAIYAAPVGKVGK